MSNHLINEYLLDKIKKDIESYHKQLSCDHVIEKYHAALICKKCDLFAEENLRLFEGMKRLIN